jgi:hypothetical protein
MPARQRQNSGTHINTSTSAVSQQEIGGTVTTLIRKKVVAVEINAYDIFVLATILCPSVVGLNRPRSRL